MLIRRSVVVLASGVEQQMPLDVTHKALTRTDRVAALRALPVRTVAVAEMLEFRTV